MEVFWICEQCDSTNNYEATKVCSVCGGKIDPKSEEKCIYEIAEQRYAKAVTSGELFEVCALYLKILGYKDARQKHSECQFKAEKTLLNEKAYSEAKRCLISAGEYCSALKWADAIREFAVAKQNFQKAGAFSDSREQAIACDREIVLCQNKEIYFAAKEILVSAASITDYKKAAELFNRILHFSDARESYQLCQQFISILTAKQDLETATQKYQDAIKIEVYETRLPILEKIMADYREYSQHKDFANLLRNCTQSIHEAQQHVEYNRAVNMMQNAVGSAAFKNAAAIFSRLSNFKDSSEKKNLCIEKAELAAKNATYASALSAFEQGQKITIFNWRKYK